MTIKTIPRWGIIALIGLPLILLAGGAWFYWVQRQQVRQGVERQLEAIARLKADQLSQWREEQLKEAALLSESPFLTENLAQLMVAPSRTIAENTHVRFRSMKKHRGYLDICLTDPNGQIQFSLSDRTGLVHKEAAQTIAAAFKTRQPVISDLHDNHDDIPLHIDVVAPFFSGSGDEDHSIGAILFQMDPQQYLYPLIQSWPTPSESAETVLFRRDGDHILFLSGLKHQADATLKLRIPLTRKDVPAVQAVLGHERVVEGTDYRGVEVFAVLKAIPDSPWFIEAKMDAAEALQEWRYRSGLMLTVIMVLALALVAGIAALWQRYGKIQYGAILEAETARAESEERYRTTLLSIGDGVVVTDAQGRVRLLNPVAEALTGWPHEEARGREISEVFHIINEQSRLPALNPVPRVLAEGLVVGLANHTILIARDGTEYPIADCAAPIHGEKGDVAGVVLVFRDQSASRTAEAALMAESSRRQALLASIPDIVMETDTNKVYTWANQAGLDFFGNDVIGREAAYYFEGEQPTYQVIQPLLEGSDSVIYVETWQRRRDGEKRLLAWWSRGLKDADGKVLEVVSSARDITDSRAMEKALRESEEDYRLLVGNIPAMVFRGWTDGSLVLYDEKIQELTGYSQKVFHSKEINWLGLIHPEDYPSFSRAFVQAVKGDGHIFREYRVRCRDGEYIWVQERSRIVRDEKGEVDWISGTLFDITDRKDAEEEKAKIEAWLHQAQKREAIGTLAGGIAHDFNNILAAIMGYTELATDGVSPESRTRSDLEEVLIASRRAKDLVSQILTISRQGDIQEKRPLKISPIVKEAMKLLRATLPTTIRFHQSIPKDVCTIMADPTQIHQVMVNLCTNAGHAMREGGGTLDVGLEDVRLDKETAARHQELEPGTYLHLSVKDTGHGMNRATLERIFDPYFTTKGVGEGSGLGLAVVQGIVKRHGGVISVTSEPGAGAAFDIFFPAVESVSEGRVETVAEEELPRGSERILLVDDEAPIVKLMERMLQDLGYQVTATADSRDALDRFTAQPEAFDLIVTDYTMPWMTGVDLAGQAMGIRPGIPVVLCTGYTDHIWGKNAKAKGIREFCLKPVNRTRLAHVVRAALSPSPSEPAA